MKITFQKIRSRAALVIGIIFLSACAPEDERNTPIPAVNEINEFVWGGLNSWYYWQGEVDDLADGRFSNLSEKNDFLNQFESPSELFGELRSDDDRFSIITNNYIALQNSFQGISRSFGFNYKLLGNDSTDQVVGFVTYTLPGTAAESLDIKRGDIIYGIDGMMLDQGNFTNLLNRESITITFAESNEGILSPLEETKTVTAVSISENPVLIAETIDLEGTKVGYLMYNQFIHTRHGEINDAFGRFVQDGVTELVLDLRYNPGGVVFTSALLASMMNSGLDETDVYSILLYNEKKSDLNFSFTFESSVPLLNADFEIVNSAPMNRLDLTRLYVLTGRSTASASELIINGLEPYLQVIQIGTTTRGKNEGSVTLYDAPATDYRDVSQANPNHLWAMQPIISKVANAQGFGDYESGLLPDVEIDEIFFYDQLLPLGDPNEQLLKIALDDIRGATGTSRVSYPHANISYLGGSDEKEEVSSGPILNGYPLHLN